MRELYRRNGVNCQETSNLWATGGEPPRSWRSVDTQSGAEGDTRGRPAKHSSRAEQPDRRTTNDESSSQPVPDGSRRAEAERSVGARRSVEAEDVRGSMVSREGAQAVVSEDTEGAAPEGGEVAGAQQQVANALLQQRTIGIGGHPRPK